MDPLPTEEPKGGPRMSEFNFDSSAFLEKSVDAFGLALETLNRLGVKYRLDAFCILYCNAFDLLLKAKQVRDRGPDSIIRRKQPFQTHELSKMLQVVFLDERHPVRRNCEVINQLRHKATHLLMPDLPPEFASVIQAAILNYQSLVAEWFRHDITHDIPIGMMTILHDYEASYWDYDDQAVRTRIGDELAGLLSRLGSTIAQADFDDSNPYHFAIPLDYKLRWTDATASGITVVPSADNSSRASNTAVTIDHGKTHPYRQTDVLTQINSEFGVNSGPVNQYDLQAVNSVYDIRSNRKMHYRSQVANSPRTYSQEYVDWLVQSAKDDPEFFSNACEKYQAKRAAAE